MALTISPKLLGFIATARMDGGTATVAPWNQVIGGSSPLEPVS
jgi:hypothetical protein